MDRRQWLRGAFAAAVWSRPVAVQASSSGRSGVCAWTAGEVLVCAADGGLQRLPVDRAPDVAPVPSHHGVWVALAEAAVERWSGEAAMSWRAVERHALDEPAHALAAGDDGQHVVAAHGGRISVLGSGQGVLARLEGRSLDRRLQGPAAALLSMPGRRSIVASLPALGEMWELSLDPHAPPIHDGLVHDYRMGESLPTPGYLGARRIPLQGPMPELEFSDARVNWVAGRAGEGVAIVHLDVRRQIAALALPGARPDRALLLGEPGAWRWWVPAGDGVHGIDTTRWVQQPVVAPADAPAPVRVLLSLGDLPREVSVGPAWRIAVARADRVEVLDAHGTVLQRWPLPGGAVVQGVRWAP